MRFMVIVKSDPILEQTMPTREAFAAMGKYNQTLRDAGVLLALDGLSSSKDGARVTFSGNKPTVKDGPFTEAKELVAGFWIIQVRNKEEAVEWAKRIPFSNGESVEVRRISEAADFADIM
ncbi:MAG TPA: YciI family protein [Devosia sp.]|nr:YciI family protein [Devosia sp.]